MLETIINLFSELFGQSIAVDLISKEILTTGHYNSELVKTLKRKLTEYIKNNNAYKIYIGKTSDIDTRIQQHLSDKKIKKVLLLYKTTSKDYVSQVERELLNYYNNKRINGYKVELQNKALDPRGKTSKEKADEYFIYVLVLK